MRALTLYRPWPWAIFHGPAHCLKDVETRDWGADWIVGETVALHAGKRIDTPERIAFIERVCGVRPPEDGGPTGIIGVVRFTAMVTASKSPWFMGPVGWQIGMRQALVEPVACKGARKLWPVPADIERLVTERRTAVPLRYIAGAGNAHRST